MAFNCNSNCFSCEWRQGKSVDDVLFCQTSRLIARSKSQETAISDIQERLGSLETTPKTDFSEIPEESESIL